MRTNITLDDELMEEARRYSSARTKRALVEDALRTFVAVKSAEQRRRTYLERLRGLEPALRRLEPGRSALEILREDRHRS